MKNLIGPLSATAVAFLAAASVASAVNSGGGSSTAEAHRQKQAPAHAHTRGKMPAAGKSITYSEVHRFVNGRDQVERTDVGTISSVSATSITLKRADKSVTIAVNDKTKTVGWGKHRGTRGGKPASDRKAGPRNGNASKATSAVKLAAGQHVTVKRNGADAPAQTVFVHPGKKLGKQVRDRDEARDRPDTKDVDDALDNDEDLDEGADADDPDFDQDGD